MSADAMCSAVWLRRLAQLSSPATMDAKRMPRQAQLMDQTTPLLFGRKHEQQRLLSNKQAAANKVETELASLLG